MGSQGARKDPQRQEAHFAELTDDSSLFVELLGIALEKVVDDLLADQSGTQSTVSGRDAVAMTSSFVKFRASPTNRSSPCTKPAECCTRFKMVLR